MLLKFEGSEKVFSMGPCYLSPESPHNTFSPGATIKFSLLKEANISVFKHFRLADNNGNEFKVPIEESNGLDFIKLKIMKFTHYSNEFATISHLCAVKRRELTPIQKFKEAHLRLGHLSEEQLVNISTCFKYNRTRIPRNGPDDRTPPPPFTHIHADLVFYSVISIRGMTGAVTAIDKTTRWPWVFPLSTKRLPMSIFTFLVGSLRNMGHNPAIITVDEGGELALFQPIK
jgi:hypothetical protein